MPGAATRALHAIVASQPPPRAMLCSRGIARLSKLATLSQRLAQRCMRSATSLLRMVTACKLP